MRSDGTSRMGSQFAISSRWVLPDEFLQCRGQVVEFVRIQLTLEILTEPTDSCLLHTVSIPGSGVTITGIGFADLFVYLGRSYPIPAILASAGLIIVGIQIC